MSSCPVQYDCDMVTEESSMWRYRSNCSTCWYDRDAIITGSVPSQGSWPLIGRECMACIKVDPQCIKRKCCDLILDGTTCFVNGISIHLFTCIHHHHRSIVYLSVLYDMSI
jgi:hypothetical protein